MKHSYQTTSITGLKHLAITILFLVTFCAFYLGLNQIAQSTESIQKQTLHQAISRGIAHCYATEGHYPENLEYLLDTYGIRYDTDKYFIDYQILGQNIFPDVTIIEK
jgi:hypothetical protein